MPPLLGAGKPDTAGTITAGPRSPLGYPAPVRLGVYTDYSYARRDGVLHAEQAFSIFLAGLVPRCDRLVLIGRLDPEARRARYPLPSGVAFVALPYYQSLARPLAVARSVLGSLRRFWCALDGVDAVWLLGPHPLSIVFAALATLRRRQVVLGVRQDLPAYARRRHPGRRGLHLAADVLECAYVALSRRFPTVVVGPALGRRYSAAASLLEISVSLVRSEQLVDAESAHSRPYSGPLRVLSVGRVAPEKNPLMLADVLARLHERDGERWRLVVCGEGPLGEALATRLATLGLAEWAELRGYVPFGEQMRAIYESGHFLLHTSWTEGVPQVLIEAFAAGVPVVSTDVGGIRAAVGEAAMLVSAGDADAAADALLALAEDATARARLIEDGLVYATQHTLERELDRLAAFVSSGWTRSNIAGASASPPAEPDYTRQR